MTKKITISWCANLEKMGLTNDQTKEILDIASENGGHCDCEILFNAEEELLYSYK